MYNILKDIKQFYTVELFYIFQKIVHFVYYSIKKINLIIYVGLRKFVNILKINQNYTK